MFYVLSNGLLSVEYYIAQLEVFLVLEKLRRFINHSLYQFQKIVHFIASIAIWRLFLLVLKRIMGIVKTGLKYFLIELPVPALEFLYVLHFGRAFLTVIDFFQDRDNKNLVEIIKFLYACFKVFISLLIINVLVILLIQGVLPLGLTAYTYIKILFRIYTFSKFGISLLALGFSYYKIKSYSDDVEHAWLKANYQANAQKHMHILVLGTPIVTLLTVVSVFGAGLGPIGLAVAIVLASLLLALDIAKAIYFYSHPCIIPEPSIGDLIQQNSLIDFSSKDYYFRKCRIARLSKHNLEANQIYLLKEIIVKIAQLQTKLKNCSSLYYNFFSEKSKIKEKIFGLIHEGNSLLCEEDEANQAILEEVIEALRKDYRNIKDSKTIKTLIDKDRIENFINKLKESNSAKVNQVTCLGKLLLVKKSVRKSIPENLNSQRFQQSLSRKLADSKDLAIACQSQRQKEINKVSTVISLQIHCCEASTG